MTKRRTDLELLVVGLSAFVANAIMAYLVVFRLNLFLTDAMARTRSAWQVFFSGEPKLANVGFVWAPLPTLLQLPFVLIPPLRYKGLSGNLVTVLAGAASAMLVALFLRRTKLPALLRWLMVAAFVLNPMVIFYSSNGMSEMVVILFVLAATYLYIRWHETGLWTYLAGAGAATGAAFLARYDALFVAVALTMAIGLEALVRRPDRPRFSESSVLMFGAPVAYIVALWIASNWAIMGDPLFFARSIYSNAGQIGYQLTIYTNLVPLKGNLSASLQASLLEAWNLFPAFILFSAALLLLLVSRGAWHWLGVLAIAWSLTLFSAANVYAGQSALFLRYFITAIPMAFVLAVGILQQFDQWQIPVALALLVVLVVSGFSSAQAMRRHTEWGQWNDVFVEELLSGQPNTKWQEEQDLADYINKQTTGRVLVDDFEGYRVIFFSGRPERFLTPADSTFNETLHDPAGRVDYIMVSEPILEGQLNAVNKAFPTLYTLGGSWVKLEKTAFRWKLYQVIGSPSQLPATNAAAQPSSP